MGMYDEVLFRSDISKWNLGLDITQEELESLTFQTKDLECSLNHYIVGPDDMFYIDRTPWSSDLENNQKKKELIFNNYKFTNREGIDVVIPFSGIINIYSNTSQYKWLELVLEIVRCKLTSVYVLEGEPL